MSKPYDPSKPITIGNWPENVRMPPRKKLEKKPAGKHEGSPSRTESEKPPLWDFSDLPE